MTTFARSLARSPYLAADGIAVPRRPLQDRPERREGFAGMLGSGRLAEAVGHFETDRRENITHVLLQGQTNPRRC